MAEFLDLIESIRAEEADTRRLFAGEGAGAHSVAARLGPRYLERLAEAAQFVQRVFAGRTPLFRFQEMMTTSDFPYLFADILDRQMLGRYTEWPVTWPSVAKRSVVNDFRSVKRFLPPTGAESVLTAVPERAPYPEVALTEQAPITYAVTKYGQKAGFSFEAMINDDMDALKDIPERFARAARRTEEYKVTQLFVDANGPHASLYTSGNANIVNTTNGASDDNPPLSISGLQDAMLVLGNQVDEVGEPIMIETVTLVVPPALEIVAQNILNATEIIAGGNNQTGGGGVAAQALRVANWMRNRVNLVVNPYIPIIASSANGNTTWFLFANPNSGRPAIEVGFLRGHETPEIFIKEPNTRRVGGGTVDPMNGDWDTDSIEYKVRHVLGMTRIDARVTVGSNGSSN